MDSYEGHGDALLSSGSHSKDAETVFACRTTSLDSTAIPTPVVNKTMTSIAPLLVVAQSASYECTTVPHVPPRLQSKQKKFQERSALIPRNSSSAFE